MNNPRRQVSELWQNPLYRDVVAFIEAHKPLPPKWEPGVNNVEQMKYQSAQLQMYEFVITVLKPKATGEPS